MRWQIPLVAVLALFVAVSCDQQPVEPPADQVAEAPAFNFSNGPSNPGASMVFRGDEPLAFSGTDPARDLVSMIGLGDLDPTQSELCVTAGTVDIDRYQDVVAGGSVRSHNTWQNPTVHIYKGVDDFWNTWDSTSPCAAINLPRVAEGIGNKVVQTNTCLFGCENGAWSVGYRATGTLDDLLNGGNVRYLENQRLVPSVDGTFQGFLISNIFVHHIGK